MHAEHAAILACQYVHMTRDVPRSARSNGQFTIDVYLQCHPGFDMVHNVIPWVSGQSGIVLQIYLYSNRLPSMTKDVKQEYLGS